jgi:hypothetical protein
MSRFLELAARELRLTPREVEFLRANPPRSFDAVHALLLASPSLALPRYGLRRDDLLKLVEPYLSPAYRAALAEPPPADVPPGATLRRPVAQSAGVIDPGLQPPPKDWPGLGRPVSLGGEGQVDLLKDLGGPWPVRDQGLAPTCVPYAANAALEYRWAKAGQRPIRLSSSFLYQRIRARGSASRLADDGGTKLGDVQQVLAAEGVCLETAWEDRNSLDAEPDAAAMADAAARRTTAVGYWDLGRLKRRWEGSARAVLELLKQGRPVAISIPQFRDPRLDDDAPNNWWMPLVRVYGEVMNRQDYMTPAQTGHAVCLIGFQPDPDEKLGGWFILRNSVGLRWGTGLPINGKEDPPRVKARGYGAIAASHIEDCVFEIFSPA